MVYRNALWLLFLLLTAANIYIYLNYKEYEFVQQSSYADLYPNVSKGIKSITVEKNNVAAIDLKGYAAAKWSISCNDTVIAKDVSLPIRFSFKRDLNRYVLSAADSTVKQIIIDVDYAPDSLYKAESDSASIDDEIRYCSVPFVYGDTAEMNAVKKIIDSLPIKPGDSTVTKIKVIGEYIYRSINKQIGVPADSLNNYSVYQQFCSARDGRAKIWCGNITDIFHLFATKAGIVCRNLGVAGRKNDFRLGDHSMNECYLPESGEWAYVDITQNILLLKDSMGRYLNTVDLYQLKKQRHANGLIQVSVSDSSIIESSYADADRKYVWKENKLLFPYPYNPKTLYSFFNKLRRYVGAHPWLAVYSENYQYNNYHFYLKSFLFHAWLLLLLIMLVLYLFTKKRKV